MEEFLQAAIFQGRAIGKWWTMMDVLSEASQLSHNSHLSEMFKGAVHPVKSSTPACASGFFLRELTSLCNFDISLLRFLAYCTYLDAAIRFLLSHHWFIYLPISPSRLHISWRQGLVTDLTQVWCSTSWVLAGYLFTCRKWRTVQS